MKLGGCIKLAETGTARNQQESALEWRDLL